MRSRRGGTTTLLVVTTMAALVLTASVQPTRPPLTNTDGHRTQDHLDAELIDAAWTNDVDAAARLIAMGADVNARDWTRQSAYLIAASEGYLELLELTLRSGAFVPLLDSYRGTALIRAAERGHTDVVGRLLQEDAMPVDHVNRLGWTALHEAVILGDGSQRYVDTVRLLIAGGADLERVSVRDDLTALQHARSLEQARVAEVLEAAAEASPPDDPEGALLDAAATGDADGAAIALRHGADAGGPAAAAALRTALADDHASVVRLLRAVGASLDP